MPQFSMCDDQTSFAMIGQVFEIIKPLIIRNSGRCCSHHDDTMLLVLNVSESGVVANVLSEIAFGVTEGDKKHQAPQ
ncbi:MAG: hypothetical protein VX737_04210 [Pseudomonadota bacterium]|nr:hypothetical protein [Pseudomonadota bacterium]